MSSLRTLSNTLVLAGKGLKTSEYTSIYQPIYDRNWGGGGGGGMAEATSFWRSGGMATIMGGETIGSE